MYNQLGWQTDPVQTDGTSSEYPVMRFYNRDIKLAYNLSNDNKNLYFCFKIEDQALQQRILRAGLEIYLDSTAKPVKRSGIVFPLPAVMRERYIRERQGQKNDDLPEQGQPDKNIKRQKYLSDHKSMELRHLGKFNGVYPIEGKTPVKLSLNWDASDALIYEGVVPLELFYHAPLRGADSLRTLNFTVSIKPLLTVGDPNMVRNRPAVSVGMGTGTGFGGGFGSPMGAGVGVTIGGPRSGMGQQDANSFTVPFKFAVHAN